jgi:S-methylmethionine-dependent homocysteine/selenocysteine methylase
MLHELRDEYASGRMAVVISGCIGPRGDGYAPNRSMTPAAATAYHLPQIETLKEAGVDMISAYTLPAVEEAIGMVQAARQTGTPIVISFKVETDGRLPSGDSLRSAVE